MSEEHSQSAQLGESVQLNASETLDSDDMNDDALDSGYVPPDRPSPPMREGVTAEDQLEGESLDDRLRQEIPDGAEPNADPDRAGRLVADDEGVREDQVKETVAHDVGIDGGAASAEEGAVHVEEPPD